MSVSAQPELYKDKIEVSLDGRQIFYLFFGGAVLAGMVFVLGVMVGRRVESRSHVDQIGRPERATSDPLAALDALEGKKLTFPSALATTAPKTDVEHKIDQIEAARTDKPEPPKVDKPAADPKADKKKPEKAEKIEKADKPITKPEQAVEPKPEKKDAVAKSDKPKPAKKADVAPINGDVVTASDDKKADDKKADDKKSRPMESSIDDKLAGAKKGKFTLQLSSFQDKHEAEVFLSSVKAAGYQAYVTETEISGKGTFYRVRLGKYGSQEAANDAKADVEKALKKTASVMPL